MITEVVLYECRDDKMERIAEGSMFIDPSLGATWMIAMHGVKSSWLHARVELQNIDALPQDWFTARTRLTVGSWYFNDIPVSWWGKASDMPSATVRWYAHTTDGNTFTYLLTMRTQRDD